MKKNRWFRLFSSCKIIDGASASLLVDIERNELNDLTKPASKLLKEIQRDSIDNFKSNKNYDSNFIDFFLKQFVDDELGFFTDIPESFPEIENNWPCPYKITNAVIEIENLNNYDVHDVIDQINNMDCQAYQLIFNSSFKVSSIKRILSYFNESRVKYVEIIIPHSELLDLEILNNFIKEEPRLRFIKIYGSPKDDIITSDNLLLNNKILYFRKNICTDQNEIIKKNRFIKNPGVFFEAQSYNVGLNRKIAIDKDGNIKNFIFHEKIFGNVLNEKINNIVQTKEFQKKWYINNDSIEQCKDCQYRYVCISNSDVYKKNNRLYKKDYCNFDPYTNAWT